MSSSFPVSALFRFLQAPPLTSKYQGRFYVGGLGAGGHVPPERAPRFTCCPHPQIQKLAGKMYAYMEFVFFRFQRTDKMDSVVKGLMGQCPSLVRIFGLEPPLVNTLFTCWLWRLVRSVYTVEDTSFEQSSWSRATRHVRGRRRCIWKASRRHYAALSAANWRQRMKTKASKACRVTSHATWRDVIKTAAVSGGAYVVRRLIIHRKADGTERALSSGVRSADDDPPTAPRFWVISIYLHLPSAAKDILVSSIISWHYYLNLHLLHYAPVDFVVALTLF